MRNIEGHREIKIIFFSLIVFLSGCAGSPGQIEAVTPVSDRAALTVYDTLTIRVDAAPTAKCSLADAERIAQLTKIKVEELEPARFERILVVAGEDTAEQPPHLDADLTLTCYERGDAAARALMAGLGQMQISGALELSEQPADRSLGVYNLDKRFAWGGIYGATTDIEDIEIGFAEAAAKVILGEQ